MAANDPKLCCRCGKDVSTGSRYTARRPLPTGASDDANLYDCPRCAVNILMKELKEEKEKHQDTKVELDQKTQELATASCSHHKTKVELDKKTDELYNAEMQCAALQLAFRTHSSTLKKKDKAAFDGLVTKQLESIMIQGAKKRASWCTKQANDAEQQAAELQEKAAELRAKALSLGAAKKQRKSET